MTASQCKYGPVFRKIDRWSAIEHRALHPGALATILKQRAKRAELTAKGLDRISANGLRAGFVTEAVKAGARKKQIMCQTRHKDLKSMRGYCSGLSS